MIVPRLRLACRGVTIAAVLAASRRRALAQPALTSSTPNSWMQFRHGIDNSGVVGGTLTVHWAFKAPRPVRAISAADGVVILGTESADADARPGAFAPDQRGFVVALDATTGRQLWTRAVASWIHSDPTIYCGVVFVTYGRWPMTHAGGISALELHSGRVLWSFTAESGMMPGSVIDSSANLVIAAGGDGILYSFDLRSGSLKHKFGLGSADAMSSPRMDGAGSVFLGAANTINRYASDQGALVWSLRPRTLQDLGDIPPALSDSLVFTTGTRFAGFTHAAAELPLREFWRLAHTALSAHRMSSYKTWFREQSLIAVRRSDGTIAWQQPLGIGLEVPRNTSGTPVLAGVGRVIVSSPVSRIVWAFDTRTGKTLWHRRLENIHKGAVTIADREVVLGDAKGAINVFRITDGAPVGRCSTGAAFTPTAPLLIGHTLIVATKDGWVHAAPYAELHQRAMAHTQCFNG